MSVNLTILIVEDEPTMSKALELKLNKAGFNTVVSKNGEEAFSVLTNQSIQFMLLDLIMPKLDGMGLLRKMHDLHIEVPFIIISNLSQEEDILRARQLGAKEYLVKANTSVNQIVDLVKHYIETGAGSESSTSV